MASQHTLTPLLRSLSLLRPSPCNCARSLPLPPSSARPFSTTPTRHMRRAGPRSLPFTSSITALHPSNPLSGRNDGHPNQLRHSSSSSTSRSRSATFAKRPRTHTSSSDTASSRRRTLEPTTATRLAFRRQGKEESRLRREADAWAEAFKFKDTEGGVLAKEAKGPAAPPTKDKEKALPSWKKHKLALQSKFPAGWAPPKRISREAMDLVRTLARSDPGRYTTPVLAAKFKISPEAVSKILKSRFALPQAEREKREAKRKEARARGIREGEGCGAAQEGGKEQVWEGDLGAQRREMEELRRKREQQKDSVLEGW